MTLLEISKPNPRRSSLLVAAALALVSGLGTSTKAAIDMPLPSEVVSALVAASEPRDIATLILVYPELAATLMFEAAVLGIASPTQVLALMAPDLQQTQVLELVTAAVEAAPAEADTVIQAAFRALEGQPQSIAVAAISGLEAAGLDDSAIRVETLEIVEILSGFAPESSLSIAEAAAAATSTQTDSAEILSLPDAASADTAGVAEPGATGLQAPAEIIQFRTPSETQNNPSGN